MDIKKFSCCKRLLWVVLGLVVVAVIARAALEKWEFRDDDPDRGATTVKADIFGDSFTQVKYLDQGWKPKDSLWFYTTSQGSNLIPYDFFLVLEQVDNQELFRANENINAYRYLPQKPTSSNPDGLPVGFVKDTYKGKAFMGFTCAACHSSQVNYKGTAMRIDGGPAGADMYNLVAAIAGALRVSQPDAQGQCTDKCERFVKNVLALGNYDTQEQVLADLRKYTQRIDAYYFINEAASPYGYARLDAFGRIYNRVLEHTMNKEELEKLLKVVFTPEELDVALNGMGDVLNSDQRDHVFYRVSQKLAANFQDPADKFAATKKLVKLRDKIFNKADAPVSYPFLWDIPQHDYVQWNGLASNGGLGPVGRNAGEVIGVFGTLDWKEDTGFSLFAGIGGQSFFGRHVSYDSSVDVRNLRRVENHLIGLQSPRWNDPNSPLPPLNEESVKRGARVFDKYCVSCHANIRRDDPDRRVVASMTRLSDIKTDPKMADNAVKYMGYSGITRNEYVATDVGNILLNERAPAAAILTQATTNVVATPDPDMWRIRQAYEWLYNLAKAFLGNEIRPSVKSGNYEPDTTANPYASLAAYKGRSLNGIWATAPYLHNGSVPTLYDLLLPSCPPGRPAAAECRPNKFEVGSREFDPVKVGFVSSGYKGFIFDTSLLGNSNAGHEYGTAPSFGTTVATDEASKQWCARSGAKIPMKNAQGVKLLCPLTAEERGQLLEYLKSL